MVDYYLKLNDFLATLDPDRKRELYDLLTEASETFEDFNSDLEDADQEFPDVVAQLTKKFPGFLRALPPECGYDMAKFAGECGWAADLMDQG